ncbi:MAG: hypothetical protein R3Y26_01905 [Rikenellaceae bacterium]
MSEELEKLVVYKRFATLGEAKIVESLLSAMEIYTEVIGEGTAELFPGSSSEMLHAGLLVRKEDIERIDAVLNARFKESDLTNEFK